MSDNVSGECRTRVSAKLWPGLHHTSTLPTTSQYGNMERFSNESQTWLALRAIQQDEGLSIRCIAVIDKVAERMLRRPRNCMPNSIKLTEVEESLVVWYVLKLEDRICSPRLSNMKGMANSLLVESHQRPVDKN